MKRKKRAFTLIELLVVVAIIALLISILLPSLSRARELSKRLVCGTNVKGNGTAYKIYANDYEDHWPTVPFSSSTAIQWSNIAIGYGHNANLPPVLNPGAYPNRQTVSTGDTTVSGAPAASTSLSVTRSMWMLVRSGDITPREYTCPSSGDTIPNEQNIDLFYDFKEKTNISFGYQVPFGPFGSRASEAVDQRMAVHADKGPYTSSSVPNPLIPSGDTTNWKPLTGFDSPLFWRKYNSPNHGGAGSGEGQNVLYGDGHATFEKTPDVGIDHDNIYTKQSQISSASPAGALTPMASGIGIATGNSGIGNAVTNWNYPGYKSLNGTSDSTTDSLIFP